MASKIPSSAAKNAARLYSAKAAQAPQAASAAAVHVSKLPSGTVVATTNEDAPLSTISVFLRGGSRYNTEPGASHFFSLCARYGYSSHTRTGLDLIHTCDQLGGVYNVTAGREVAAYTMTSTRDHVGGMLDTLSSFTSNNTYAHHEFPTTLDFPKKDELHNFKAAIAERPWMDRAVDMATKAAFRSQTLGHSIYMPKRLLGLWKFDAEQMNNFMNATHGASGLVVVGSGIEHEVLSAGAAAFGVSGAKVATQGTGTRFLSGDMRLDMGGNVTAVCVLGEGAKFGPERFAALVAANLLGSPTNVTHGNTVNKAEEGSVHALSESYADIGVLGLTLKAPAAEAPEKIAQAVAAAKKFSPSDKEVEGAKNRVKLAFLRAGTAAEVAEIGQQLLITGNCMTQAETLKAIDAVTKSDVQKVVTRAFTGKLSVGSIGEIQYVPYPDTL